jgi:hypothetical protein
MADKQWHDCPCGESIAVPDSPFGAAMLAEWRRVHAHHEPRPSA